MDVQLKRGLLETCVLKVLTKGDSYGYRIIKDVSPYIEISESTLYPILKRLEAGSLLNVKSAEHNGRLRKYYSINSCGIRRIEEFINEWKSVMTVYNFISSEDAPGGTDEDPRETEAAEAPETDISEEGKDGLNNEQN